MEYEAVIGLEVHAQLNTTTKLFCSCLNKFGSPANTQTCPICQGHPGVLPVLNEGVLSKAIKAGLATESKIANITRFDRKHYFYPDLPKAYQISQFDQPICEEGKVKITVINEDGSSYDKTIGLTRIHMEEDAGKLIHAEGGLPLSYVDLNRAGTPLIEIVSEPEISTPEEAYQYLSELKKILKYIEVSDCNMEEGSLRCDANISIRPKGDTELGVKAEIKNMNSFKGVRLALEYEIKRQIKLATKGERIITETRLFDAKNNVTRSMRSKEGAHDYRYLPDPDLCPQVVSDMMIKEVRDTMPELPRQKFDRFKSDYELPDQDIVVLTETKEIAEYYEKAIKSSGGHYKKIANWIMVEVNARLNEKLIPISEFNVSPESIAEMVLLIEDGTISGKIAKEVFEDMVETGDTPKTIIERKGLKQMSDSSKIEGIISGILSENEKSVADYKAGKNKAFGFLVGQTMKATKGQANPKMVNEILKQMLDK